MIRRTLREWQRIGYGDDENTIPETYADRIAAIAQRSAFAGRGGEGVLEHRRKSLRARWVNANQMRPPCADGSSTCWVSCMTCPSMWDP